VQVVQDYRHLLHSEIQTLLLDSQDHQALSGLLVVEAVDQNLITLEDRTKVALVGGQLALHMQAQE
tara:strand:+ start:236 stop:433 length:198 start_codon:yes stop_codon:yes gene_type:complete